MASRTAGLHPTYLLYMLRESRRLPGYDWVSAATPNSAAGAIERPMINQTTPAIIASPPEIWSAPAQPICAARIGVIAGEMKPPMLLPIFMVPPAAPL